MHVLVLGGGVAGLTAAERAAQLGHQVTVVQRGHRLGGKGASHRTADGRIIEHGLHVWPGYYDNAFALIRRCHGSTDGPPPGFFPAPAVGVADPADWSPWIARFTGNDKQPGIDTRSPTVTDFVRQCGDLLTDLIAIGAPPVSRPKDIYLSGRPKPPTPTGTSAVRLVTELTNLLVGATVQHLPRLLPEFPHSTPGVDGMLQELRRMLSEIHTSRHSVSTQIDAVVDLIITCLLGIYRDGLLQDPSGFAAINDLDFREWLAKHGASQSTLDCGVVRGMYDLVFGYEGGDHDLPSFEAGTGLGLAARFFFDFKGALFWKMEAGMGDVVFAPLYRRLKDLDVAFSFFHRVDEVVTDESNSAVVSVRLGRQAALADGVHEYEPLVTMNGMDVFPAEPLSAQLSGDGVASDLEHHASDRGAETAVTLQAGQDFDAVILATSIGMIPHVCPTLVEQVPAWRAMVESVTTVATQALQVWTNQSTDQLGWEHAGSTVAGYPSPFDTYADMSHLIPVEDTGDGTESIAYFCAALPDSQASDPDPRAIVRANAADFLETRSHHIWPEANASGFDWDVLVGRAHGTDRLDEQFIGANADPSDRYVQSRPGSGRHRLRADGSGIDNLFLAGDWIDSGLNAGCIEAATIAGIQAANAASQVPLCDGVLGGWQPVGNRPAQPTTATTDREPG